MEYREVEPTREFVCGLSHGADWRGELETLATEETLDAAFFVALGAVQDATIFFYDQDRQEYDAVEFDEPFEVASCVGNIATLEGEPFAHTHAVLSRPDGTAIAGHLDAGTVFAGEAWVRAFEEPLVREHDAVTDLDLWSLDAT